MTADEWARTKRLLEAALDQPVEQRAAFVHNSNEEEFIRREALRLMREVDRDDGFLGNAPAHLAHELISNRSITHAFSAGDLAGGRFRIERRIGAGGMGEVYEAHDLETGISVALKTVRRDLAATPAMVGRIRTEMVLARSVAHRNVCRIFDLHLHVSGSGAAPVLFFTMELLQGETLAEKLAHNQHLPAAQVLAIVKQLAAGLTEAHRLGIVHGDLKPSNIMLEPSENPGQFRVVIMDFGIASVRAVSCTASNESEEVSSAGTPGYTAPEVLQGKACPASDIYSLGAVMREMLAGKSEAAGLGNKISLSSPWKGVIERCLEPEPSHRFEDANQVVAALQNSRRAVWLSAAVLSVVLAAFFFWPRQHGAAAGNIRSVAVIGFRNLSGNNQAGYLALALEFALDADLASVNQVRVISPSEVSQRKAELGITTSAALTPDMRSRLRSNLGADLFVTGSYTVAPDGSLNCTITGQDAGSGRVLATVSSSGDENDLAGVISRAGSELRSQMNLGPSAAGSENATASLPGSLDAVRLYTAGLDQLRTYKLPQARHSLEQAIAADPAFALAHSALAKVWSTLGYDQRARDEARKALDLAAQLPPAERLQIEAEYWEAAHNRAKAAAAYRALLAQSLNNPDYLLLLAAVEDGADALNTVAAIRRLGPPLSDDPRVDLAEAKAADAANNYHRARAAAQKAIKKALALGALHVAAQSYVELGWAGYVLTDLDAAREAYSNAANLFAKVDDSNGQSAAFRGLALAAQHAGDLATAHDLYSKDLAITQQTGSVGEAALATNGLAMVASSQGRLDEAEALYRQSLRFCQDLQGPRCIATALNNIGYVLLREGHLKEARRSMQDSLDRFTAGNQPYGRTFALSSIGDLLAIQGADDEAQHYLETSLAISRKLGDRTSEATTTESLAELFLLKGDLARAEKLCREALQMEDAMSARDVAAKSRILLARVLLAGNHADAAQAQVQHALPVLMKSARRDDIALAQGVSAEAESMLGNTAAALHDAAQAMRTLGNSQSALARILVLISTAKAFKYCGEPDRTRENLEMAARLARQTEMRALARLAESSGA